jgi:integrase
VKESFRIVKSARAKNRQDAKDAEDEHRRALRLGQIHPRDPWPQPTISAPPIFRVFAKEFLQYATTHTKPGTVKFYEGCLDRLLAFVALADATLNAITGDLVSRYARHRQEVAQNSIVTVNGDLRTLRRILKIAEDWGRLERAPTIHELPPPKGRDRVLSFKEEALYLAHASDNLRHATILAVDTGMRPNSELFPLKWADVDLTVRPECPHGVIHVRQGKTANSQRSLPLTPRAAQVLQQRKLKAQEKPEPSAFVFPGAGQSGHIISLQHPHEDSIKDAHLQPFEFYCAGVTPSGQEPQSRAWIVSHLHASWGIARPRVKETRHKQRTSLWQTCRQIAGLQFTEQRRTGKKTKTLSAKTGYDPSWSPDGKSILLTFDAGGTSSFHSERPGIAIYDLGTRKLSLVPGTKQLFSPRWSPDGRYIAAITNDSLKLMLFNRTSQQWQELASMPIGYPSWSHDGQYIYFDKGCCLLSRSDFGS